MLNALLRQRYFWLLVAVFGLVHLALRLHFLAEPFERDEGFYATVATVMLDGGMPYRDAIDIKPPGVFLIYALFIGIGGESMEAVRIGTALWSVATLIALALVVRAVHGTRAGLLAGGMFAVFGATPLFQANSANTEVFLGLPMLLWYYGMVRYCAAAGRLPIALAGLGAALAIVIKTVMLPFFVLSLVVVLVLARRGHTIGGSWIRPVEWLFLFPLTLFVALAAWFAAKGALNEFLHWNFRVPFNYLGATAIKGPDLLVSLSRRYDQLLPFVAPALAYGVFRLVRSRARIDAENILAWAFLCSIVAFLLPGKNFPHYYILLLPFGCALSAVALSNALCAPRTLWVPVFALWAGALFLFGLRAAPWYLEYDPNQVSYAKYGSDLFIQARDAGRYIAQQTQPNETIFQWGFEPQIYFGSKRRPASRYLASVMPLLEGNDPKALNTLRNELIAQRPRYIVISEATMMTPGLEVISGVIRDLGYRFETVFPYSENGKTLRLALFRLP